MARLPGTRTRGSGAARARGRRLAAALAWALAAAACRPATAPPPGQTVQPYALGLREYYRGLRTASLDSDAGRLTMLVDTGGGATLVVPAVAARLGCTPSGRDVGHRMTGEIVVFQRCPRARLRADGFEATIDPLAVFDVNTLLPAELPRVDGVLALDAFRGHLVTIDWPGARIRVDDSADAGASLPFRVATDTNGRFFSALVQVDGTAGALWFLLDSGNLRGTLVARHVLDQGLLGAGDGQTRPLAVGGRPPRQVRVEPADLVIDGALGVDTLLQGPVTLDLRRYGDGAPSR